jgi:hypothetical protein
MDKQTLFELFKENGKRKDSTSNAYATRISGLAKKFQATDQLFLQDYESIFNSISTNATSTQANCLSSIIEYLTILNEHTLVDEYKKRKELLDNKIDKEYQKNPISKNQQENMITYEELLKYCDMIDKEVSIYEAKPMPSLNDEWILKDLKNIKILLRLYLLHPTRNEYCSLQFIPFREYKKIKEPEFNYIVLPAATGKRKPFLSITNYKTQDKYGLKITELQDKPLVKILRDLHKQIGNTYLFKLSKTGEPWQSHNLCSIMTKYSRKLIDKNISSTILYKIVIKEAGYNFEEALKNDDFIQAEKFNEILQKYAKTRGHSRKIQDMAYIANN